MPNTSKQLTELEKEFNQTKNPLKKAEIANTLGKLYRDLESSDVEQRNSELNNSLNWYKRELQLSNKSKKDQIDCNRNLYETQFKIYELNQANKKYHEKAKEYLDRAFSLAQQIGEKQLQEIYTVKGQYYHKIGVNLNSGFITGKKREINKNLKSALNKGTSKKGWVCQKHT